MFQGPLFSECSTIKGFVDFKVLFAYAIPCSVPMNHDLEPNFFFVLGKCMSSWYSAQYLSFFLGGLLLHKCANQA